MVDPKKGPILKAAFQLYAKNHSRLEDIAHFLASKGLVSRHNNPLHKDRVTFFLSDPFYIGLFRFNGEIHEGKHEPPITKKLFTKVQEVLKARGKTVMKTSTPKVFTGLLRCGTCGIVAGKQQEVSSLTTKLQRLLDSYLDQDIEKETYRKKSKNLW